ncbi:TPA: acylneuraminate cytidylyltransferase family protein [Campylobacter jejuni]|nr:acylneuraminate cytidylyltransferase family protein [Campylobacter jejuni]HDZ5090801.1 acylneuraminate cytidylyltransferase family protein [Campylobacter jejuni]HDZ5092713.1 acylneuraminate cytidylyltransferase family protein [Campylobacter jejuni]HDZ5101119.1 acylneuraminate cytidylyltransferase family protein [Campylobacter jejuni]HDZ5107610.1 acylneuraminate cytidylyltransferase family protein [Campylobacter jejuni]
MKINVFLPCRKGSERVPRKNIKPFGKFQFGLLENKLNQFLKIDLIDNIFISSDDNEVLDYAGNLKDDRIILHKRDKNLSSSKTQTDELIIHACELIQEGEILWTHVTSPFFNEVEYSRIIKTYKDCLKNGYDSIMSVTKFQGFFCDQYGKFNYNREKIKWPQTQSIEPLFEINSAVFMANVDIYKTYKDRIGQKPYLYVIDKINGFDIDWDEDFKIAEILYKNIYLENNL